MQKNLCLLLACALVVLLAICLAQSFQISNQRAQLVDIHDLLSSQREQIKTLQATVKRMEAKRADYKKEIRDLSEKNSDSPSESKKLTAESVSH